jgi:hypothetical protein
MPLAGSRSYSVLAAKALVLHNVVNSPSILTLLQWKARISLTNLVLEVIGKSVRGWAIVTNPGMKYCKVKITRGPK